MHNYNLFPTFTDNLKNNRSMTRQKMFSLPVDGVAKLSLKLDTTPRVYSSFFNNSKKLQAGGVVMVCIAQFAPRFISGVVAYKKLAPTKTMLAGLKAGTMPHEDFREQYEEILGGCNPAEIHEELLAMGGGKSVAIMCYEKPPDTCHRHAVTDWLNKAGIEVKEYPF